MTDEQRLKKNCRVATKRAVDTGKLEKRPCEVCGSPDVHAHHKDYGNPYGIIWLCRKHHLSEHKKSGPLCLCSTTHPLAKISKASGWAWGQIAEYIRDINHSDQPSRNQLSQIVCGRQISPKMAQMIHNAFPVISRENLIYYKHKRVRKQE